MIYFSLSVSPKVIVTNCFLLVVGKNNVCLPKRIQLNFFGIFGNCLDFTFEFNVKISHISTEKSPVPFLMMTHYFLTWMYHCINCPSGPQGVDSQTTLKALQLWPMWHPLWEHLHAIIFSGRLICSCCEVSFLPVFNQDDLREHCVTVNKCHNKHTQFWLI